MNTLQSLWFLRAAEGTPWFLVAVLEIERTAANLPALFEEYAAIKIMVRDIVVGLSTAVPSITMRQEWNTPPRPRVDDMQPNVP